MPIENVFSIAGRGTVVTGKIEQGTIRSGDAIEIVGLTDRSLHDVVTKLSRSPRFSRWVAQGTTLVVYFERLSTMLFARAKYWLHAIPLRRVEFSRPRCMY